MGDDANQDRETLEARVARLEARITRLEAGLITPRDAAHVPAAPPPVPPVPRAPAPAAGPGTYWQLPAAQRPITVPYATPASAALPAIGGPATQGPPAPSSSPPFAASLAELEERLAGRALAVVGGIALILGSLFFLSLAFSRGWIGPELRVLIGLAAGSAGLAAGGLFLERRNTLLGNVLTPVGLAVISISLIGATRLYHIAPTEVGLAGALLSAAIVAMVAVRNDSQLVAGFGLVSVLVAPPFLGASPDSTTVAYIGAVLIGTTSVALWRSWRWLPPIAFLLTVPQVAVWVGSQPATTVALLGITAYWALNVVAAGGEEFRRHRDDLSASSATLLLGNVAFLLWTGFVVLGGELAIHRGLFLVGVAAAHLALGGFFVARDGERNLFALLTIGTGIAALTMAMPIQLGAPAVPIAWTAEAVALAWVAVRRGHPYSAAVSAILYALAAIAVMGLYPPGGEVAPGLPFLDARGAALAFFLAGVACGVWIVRDRDLRSILSALGLGVATYSMSIVLEGLPFVAAVTGLMVLTAAIIRELPKLPSDPIKWLDGLMPRGLRAAGFGPALDLVLPVLTILLGIIAAAHLISVELPLGRVGQSTLPPIPFTDTGALGAAILIAGVIATGWILGDPIGRRAAVLVAGAIAMYAIPFEVEAWAVAVLWVGLGLGALLISRRDPSARTAFELASATAMVGAAIDALGVVAPPNRLVVGSVGMEPLQILESSVAIAAVIVGTAALGRVWPEPRFRRSLRYGAGILAVYLLSVMAVDIVGLRIGGGIATAELRTQGHVVLSVLWAVLGVGAFVYGIRTRLSEVRVGGLALLAVATVKVFLFDLAALDVAYRVISFIALGLLLLASAWLWQRAQPKPGADPP
jgi:uncharacterized membrane protein